MQALWQIWARRIKLFRAHQISSELGIIVVVAEDAEETEEEEQLAVEEAGVADVKQCLQLK